MNPTIQALIAFSPIFLAAVLLVGFRIPAKTAMPVVYISAVQEVLFVFFSLLALNLLLDDFNNLWLEILVFNFTLLLALLSKESGIGVIFVGLAFTVLLAAFVLFLAS